MLNSRLWRLLASHNFALVVIGLLALTTALGGTLPQSGRLSPEQRVGFQTEWDDLSYWLDTLQLSHLFGSWWYSALYTALVVSAMAGTIQSLLWRLRWYRGEFAPSYQLRRDGHFSAKVMQPLGSAFGFSPSSKSQSRGVVGLWGLPVFHLGIVVIVLGGIWSGIQGFGAHLELSESEPYMGQAEKLSADRGEEMPAKLGASLRLERVRVALSSHGYLRELQAFFLVNKRDNAPDHATVEINHPLKLGVYELSLNKTGGYSAVFERIREDGIRRRMFIHFNVPLNEWNWEGEWVVERDVLVELDDTALLYEMRLRGRDDPVLGLVVKHGANTLFDGELKSGSMVDLGAYSLVFKGVVPWLGFYLATDYPKYMVFAGFIVMLGGFLVHLVVYPRRIEIVQRDGEWELRAWVMPSDWRFKESWEQLSAADVDEA